MKRARLHQIANFLCFLDFPCYFERVASCIATKSEWSLKFSHHFQIALLFIFKFHSWLTYVSRVSNMLSKLIFDDKATLCPISIKPKIYKMRIERVKSETYLGKFPVWGHSRPFSKSVATTNPQKSVLTPKSPLSRANWNTAFTT